jgi:hypothetical protein
MIYPGMALSLCIILFGAVAAMAGSVPLGPSAWLGRGTLTAGADHGAQTILRQTQSMNCNQRYNTKCSQEKRVLPDCRDNRNALLIQCCNIANTIQN